jgi:mevalonate kinase
MFIVSTQKQRDTKKIVSAVRSFKESNAAEFEELIGTIGNVASELTELLQEPQLDKYSVWDFISMN